MKNTNYSTFFQITSKCHDSGDIENLPQNKIKRKNILHHEDSMYRNLLNFELFFQFWKAWVTHTAPLLKCDVSRINQYWHYKTVYLYTPRKTVLYTLPLCNIQHTMVHTFKISSYSTDSSNQTAGESRGQSPLPVAYFLWTNSLLFFVWISWQLLVKLYSDWSTWNTKKKTNCGMPVNEQ